MDVLQGDNSLSDEMHIRGDSVLDRALGHRDQVNLINSVIL